MKTLRILLLALALLPFFSSGQTRHLQHHATTTVTSQKNDSLVRGVSFAAFRQSVTVFMDSSKIKLAQRAWSLWKLERWKTLERFFTADSLNGGWPPNSGAASLQIVTLTAGTRIDRYGGYYTADSVFHDKGQFVCKIGVPFPLRALPLSSLKSPYRAYRVVKPIANVKRGIIIPWFNEPGLGIQYQLPYNIDDLKNGGYIVQISSKPPK